MEEEIKNKYTPSDGFADELSTWRPIDGATYKVNQANLELFQNLGSIIYSSQDKKYIFLPFWIEIIDGETIVMHKLGNLPKDLEKAITGLRDEENTLNTWI